ncbi:hypothetical protein HZ326_0669 [Fusarium oxysporum f. sp. albedinis]|nr:hypothetical protein HZ326_0669 [Fusarium oxysporum f. sp. albedinis]
MYRCWPTSIPGMTCIEHEVTSIYSKCLIYALENIPRGISTADVSRGAASTDHSRPDPTLAPTFNVLAFRSFDDHSSVPGSGYSHGQQPSHPLCLRGPTAYLMTYSMANIVFFVS